jgi:hypothetical protein
VFTINYVHLFLLKTNIALSLNISNRRRICNFVFRKIATQ